MLLQALHVKIEMKNRNLQVMLPLVPRLKRPDRNIPWPKRPNLEVLLRCGITTPTFMTEYEQQLKLSGQSLSRDRCDVRMATRIAPTAAMNANHYVSFNVLGIVTTAVSLIDSLGGTLPKLSNKRSNIPLWKMHDIVVSLSMAKILRKWQNMQKISISQQWSWLQFLKIKTK